MDMLILIDKESCYYHNQIWPRLRDFLNQMSISSWKPVWVKVTVKRQYLWIQEEATIVEHEQLTSKRAYSNEPGDPVEVISWKDNPKDK